jgi:hypothetical protein
MILSTRFLMPSTSQIHGGQEMFSSISLAWFKPSSNPAPQREVIGIIMFALLEAVAKSSYIAALTLEL